MYSLGSHYDCVTACLYVKFKKSRVCSYTIKQHCPHACLFFFILEFILNLICKLS